MKKKLFFHIGAHRTATSALQQYMFQNIPALKRVGVLYPFKVRRHLQFSKNIFSKARTPEQVCATLMERIDAHDVDLHTVVLSDEDICMRRNLKLLGEFREIFDVKVIFTLRRQDLWLESWHLQNVKWQWDPALSHCSFDDFMTRREDFHWIHYDRYVRHLEKVFGRENVILNVYEKQQMPEGPIKTFCDSIGLMPSEEFVKPKRMNSSFSPLISEFMRHLPLDQAAPPYRSILERACSRVNRTLYPDGNGSSLLLPYDQRVAVFKDYEQGNRALAQRYFNRDELFFDPLPDADAPLADMTLPEDAAQLMEKFVKPLLQEIIADENQRLKAGKKDVTDIIASAL